MLYTVVGCHVHLRFWRRGGFMQGPMETSITHHQSPFAIVEPTNHRKKSNSSKKLAVLAGVMISVNYL